MNDEQIRKSIQEKLEKEYRYPHDIEVIASAIYTLKMANELDVQPLLVAFLDRVACSTYSDIVTITYQYLKRLAQSQGKLMDEEYQKIAHLFDSIHIFLDLGIEHDNCVLEKSEKLILDVFAKRGRAFLPIMDESKPWWNEVLQKYNENRQHK